MVLLDEPTTGLDFHIRKQIWDKLRKLKSTIVLTTHEMKEVDSLCNRVAVMDKGMLKAVGTQEELRQAIQGTYFFVLYVKLPVQNEERGKALKYIQLELHAGAKVVQDGNETTRVYFPKENFNLRKLMSGITNEKAGESGIVAWSLKTLPFEEVFIDLLRGTSSPV
mmetsp:Transcript_17068/g.19422  ORF Transcript_17068/g.19422 Transcript_17068/m.19422 type:complete len:166 (+) Transcript_17068:2-499(+)